MNPKTIEEIFERFQKQDANPTTELIYHSAFELLIAVLLSAQMTDAGVNKATAKLFAVANTPQKMLDLGEEKLKEYIRNINYFQNKAKHIIKTCQLLIEKHQGEVPCDRESLEALAGIGRKSANVILNTIFNEKTIAVDTHIFRVSNRIGLTHGKTVLAVEQQLMKRIPHRYLQDAHHWLVLHGRYVCTARNPKCYSCLISDLCEYPDKNMKAEKPT